MIRAHGIFHIDLKLHKVQLVAIYSSYLVDISLGYLKRAINVF